MHTPPKYLAEHENLQQLNNSVLINHKDLFQNLTFNRVDPGFVGKIYIVYTSNGEGMEPNTLGQIKILDWVASAKHGPSVVVEDMASGRTITVGCIPTRVFDYDVFLSCAPYSKLRWDVRIVNNEHHSRSLLFSILIRTESPADLHHEGHMYCEALKPFKALFPETDFSPAYY